MRYRQFGNTGLTVSEIGLGCARIGGFFQHTSRQELVRLVRKAFDDGITFFDTADMYTAGESESILGEAFQGIRERVVITSKGGYVLPAPKNLVKHIKPMVRPLIVRLRLKRRLVHSSLSGAVSQQDFSGTYLTKAVEASLRRLRTDYIDVYQLHAPSPEVLGRGEFVETLEKLRVQGKIRHWGVAGDHPEHALSSLHAFPSLEAVQVGLSVLEQAALDRAIPCAASRGVGVIARQVFASGWLTRAPESVIVAHLDADPQTAQRKFEQLLAYASLAQSCSRSPAELALQFSLAQQGVSVVLVGISRQTQLGEIVVAAGAPPLSHEETMRLYASRYDSTRRIETFAY